MEKTDFTTTFVVDQTPEEVFNAVNNVRGWWSEDIEGSTDKPDAVFNYHYKDQHATKLKITELIPGKKVVWLVMDNFFKFTKDKSEWKDNKIIFEITVKGNQTQLRFTQSGLVPEYECFEICRDAWSNYINNSLRSLITTGKGQPNTKDAEFNEQLLQQHKITTAKDQDYRINFTVNSPADQVFNSITHVEKWWTEDLEGSSEKLNDEFSVRFGNIHFSKQKLVEFVPGKKVVWLVTDSELNFLKDKQEWTNTKISFEVTGRNNKTDFSFTHFGLVPEVECYNMCTKGWDQYIKGSLFKLLTEGKGIPGTIQPLQQDSGMQD